MSKKKKKSNNKRCRHKNVNFKGHTNHHSTETTEPLMNSNRNDSDSSIINRYHSNEKYEKQFSDMYNRYYQIPKFKKLIDKLNDELKKFAEGRVPDYMGYQLYIYDNYVKKFNDRFTVFSGYEFANPGGNALTYDFEKTAEQGAILLLPIIYAHQENMLKCSLVMSNPSIELIQNYNAWKLLTSIFSHGLAFVLEILMNEVDSSNVKYLDDDLDTLNNRALVARFFEAVRKRERNVCYKLLGRAKDLDPGEADYLEAVAHFYDQDYDAAIRYALKVSKDCVDYGKTISLLLECYASQGDIDKLVECINSNANLKFQQLQLICLLQNIILNLNELDESQTQKIEELNDHILKAENIGVEYYGRIVKNAVDCILNIYTEFLNAYYYPIDKSPKQMPEESNFFLSLITVADIFEQFGIRNLISKIEKYEEDNSDKWLDDFRLIAIDIIGKMTGMFGSVSIEGVKMDSNDLLWLALESMYKLDLKSAFTDNIDSLIDILSNQYERTQDERVANIILLAYTEEYVCGNLNDKIKEFVEQRLKYNDANKSMMQKMVGRRLSKNAAIALESAETLYALSESVDWGWKDAGMLSLAYFRIIEVEFNQKLILPVVKIIGMDHIRSDYEAVCNSLTGEDKKIYKNNWGRIISTLEKIDDGTANVDGLMLGEMDYFFRNIESNIIVHDLLAQNMKNAIETLLINGTNIDDFISFVETNVLNDDIRNKYRNPPAHTKYLPYKTACECRDYFYQIMQQLHTVLKQTE